MNQRATMSRRIRASVVTGSVVALVTFVAVVLIYFAALAALNEADFVNIAPYFVGPGVILVILLSAVAYIDGLSKLPRLLVFSLIAGVFSAYIGSLIQGLIVGNTFATASTNATGSLLESNLIFIVITVIASFALSRRIYAANLTKAALDSTDEVHGVALVRAPAKTLNKGQVTHVKRRVVRVAKAEAQWAAYLTTLESEGFRTLEVESADAHPDSVFIEDTVVMLGQTAVLTSPGAESRRGETNAVAAVVAELGLTAQPIRLPGTLDGGDVLTVGKTVYVGRSGRTNAEGVRQFRAIASELGYTVVAVPVTKALHLKSSVTALPDGTIIGHPTLVDHPELFDRYLEVPEASGVAVVALGQSSVLISASAPATAALITDLGYRVVTVDISEFEKLEGSVTCLSVRIH
jgi:dimethylargininase